MQKKKENFKINIFNKPLMKYINDNKYYKHFNMKNRGSVNTQELILEQKEIIRPQLFIDDSQNNFLQITKYRQDFPIDKIKDGSIIKLFDKTPIPKNPTDVVCPHFYELKWANGCNFNCAWCYLNGTYRFLSGGKKPRLKNIDTIMDHLDYFLENVDGNYLLNSGELSDSLLFENDGAPLSRKIIPRFIQQNKHKLLILTKSTDIEHLLKINAQNHVITSFSLNSFKVANKWEKAPKVSDRIKAAKKLYDSGYRVRVRIDPMVPIDDWRQEYTSLIDIIFNNFTPERITFGSLRGLQSTINNSRDYTWVKYLSETSNWGKKVDIRLRLAIYSTLRNHIKKKYDFNKIALCKETIDVWNKLNMDYTNIQCNCLL